MSCESYLEDLPDYLDKKLPGDRNKQVEGHLAECSSCNEYFSKYKGLVTTINKSSKLKAGPETLYRIMIQIAKSTGKKPQ